ncbi:MAG: hypothetical protein QME47_07245 [Candidatus Thermoplasmatota archaeon]|nr:hypothetical protein [Candidatus Thermoplasmatota archaeon]
MQDVDQIIEKLRKYLIENSESNPYLVYKGVGDCIHISEKFNVKIYQGKKGFSVVTNDQETYQRILDDTIMAPVEKQHILMVDDSGFGSPVGGTLVGAVLDDNLFNYREVPVEYYQNEKYVNQDYLDCAARCGIELVDSLLAKACIEKSDVKIIICTGFVNTKLKDVLRQNGYHVEVGEITGKLQNVLEEVHSNYLRNKFGCGLYYDPKVTDPAKGFQKMIDWINEKPEERLRYAKTGWDYFKSYK